MNIDLHIHSTCSDGTDAPLVLIEKIKENHIDVFSVTDHDNVDFYAQITPSDLEQLVLIPGIEFSCVTEAGKCHILGYGMDIQNDTLQKTIAQTQSLRREKLMKRISFLEEQYGIEFSEEEKNHLFSLKAAGKPHVAQVLVGKGLADSVDAAIKTYMKALPKGKDRIDAEAAIRAITAASGLPVWAHPLGGEGERHFSATEFEKQLTVLKAFGIRGLECYYSRYTVGEIQYLLSEADKNNLLVSGGSDYHGTVKNIPLGTLCADTPDMEMNLTVLSSVLP